MLGDNIAKMWELTPYYVYSHVDPSTQEVFYIGKGKGGRAWDYLERGAHHVSKLACLVAQGHAINSWVKIERENLTHQQALEIEKAYIQAKYRNSPLLNRIYYAKSE